VPGQSGDYFCGGGTVGRGEYSSRVRVARDDRTRGVHLRADDDEIAAGRERITSRIAS